MATRMKPYAADRADIGVVRVCCVSLAATCALYGVIEIPLMKGQSPFFPTWWLLFALTAVYGLPIVVGVTTLFVGAATTRLLAGTVACLQLAVMISWVPALMGKEIPWELRQPWILTVCMVPTSYAALAWSGRKAWFFFSISSVFVVLIRVGSTRLTVWDTALLDLMRMGIISVLIMALIIGIQRKGRLFDLLTNEARETTQELRTNEVRMFEKARFDALMHDGILATLLVAGNRRLPSRIPTATQASNVLTTLETLSARKLPPDGGVGVEDDFSGSLTFDEFAGRQRALTTLIGENIVFEVQSSNPIGIPLLVSELISGAMIEALQNSIRYADVPGRAANRAIQVVGDAGGVAVYVLDDGAGFDAGAVEVARMGIAISILSRMRNTPGGGADIRSRPGAGTQVFLRWTQILE